MSYYYSAVDDNEAVVANEIPGGPAPGSSSFNAIHELGVMASPHFWQLTSLANGIPYQDHTSELISVWPNVSQSEGPPDGPVDQFIQRLPDALRDELAEIKVSDDLAQAWAECLWGISATEAQTYIRDLSRLAKEARTEGKHLYWWSTL